MIKDEQGTPFPAITVFAETIRFFKDHLLVRLRKIKDTEIHWVVTIPAIWDESAKQFMILAAANVCGRFLVVLVYIVKVIL